MTVQQQNRRVRAEEARANIETIVQCAVFLAIFSWVLYQITQSRRITEGYRIGTENKLRDEHVGELFGRKGGHGTTSHGGKEEVLDGISSIEKGDDDNDEEDHEGDDIDSNGLDLSSFQDTYSEEFQRNKPEKGEEVEGKSSERNDIGLKRRRFGEFRDVEGKVGEELQQKRTDVLTVKWSDKSAESGEKNSTEFGSLVNLGAVILKSVAEKWEVFRLSDETEVTGHDSAVARRSGVSSGSKFT